MKMFSFNKLFNWKLAKNHKTKCFKLLNINNQKKDIKKIETVDHDDQ